MRFFGLEIRRTKTAVRPLGTRDVFGWVKEPYAGAWQRGVSIDPIGTLTSNGAVYACISRIANDISKLCIDLTMEDESGISVPAPATSPYWTPLRKPNQYQNRIQFLSLWITTKLLYGNAYALKERKDLRGLVTGLYLLDPRRVTPLVTPEGDVYYSLAGDDLAKVGPGMVVPASEIIHDRCITLWHPLVGVSPLYASAVSATQGARIQSNSAVFFENMSRPSGMLTAPGEISEVTAKRLKEEWEQNYSKSNLGRTAVLGDGLDYKPMTIPAEQSQLIQQLDWTVADVARTFGMPLYKINSGPMPTNHNVEALESQYYSGCLQVLVECIELCLTEGLELGTGATAGYEVELDLDGLLRMDEATLAETLAKAVGGAIMAPNEARQRMNLKPIEGGKSVYIQQQNYSLEALAKRDAKADPFGMNKPAAAPPAAGAAPIPPTPSKAVDDQAEAFMTNILGRLDAAQGVRSEAEKTMEFAAFAADLIAKFSESVSA